MMEEDERRRRAREIAQARYGFWWHLPIYILVNIGFVALWWYNGTEAFFWPVFPLVFWGIGLVAHFLSAYTTMGRTWIEEETERILEGQKRRR